MVQHYLGTKSTISTQYHKINKTVTSLLSGFTWTLVVVVVTVFSWERWFSTILGGLAYILKVWFLQYLEVYLSQFIKRYLIKLCYSITCYSICSHFVKQSIWCVVTLAFIIIWSNAAIFWGSLTAELWYLNVLLFTTTYKQEPWKTRKWFLWQKENTSLDWQKKPWPWPSYR